jgi:hypothetical protein
MISLKSESTEMRFIEPLFYGLDTKVYPGRQFSSTILTGIEQQCYQFFYLFILVPLTQHNHHSAHILFLHVVCFFFQIQLDQTVPMLEENASNTCSAKTYYINRLTHKNCKSVNTSNPTVQPTD